MARTAARHPTRVDDGQVYVVTHRRRVEIGRLDDVVRLVGGPAYTITYSEEQKRRYPDLDTSDEGLTVDVVDVVNSMVLDDAFVSILQRLPPEPVSDDDDVSPRVGLFVGRLLSNLESGLD